MMKCDKYSLQDSIKKMTKCDKYSLTLAEQAGGAHDFKQAIRRLQSEPSLRPKNVLGVLNARLQRE